MLAAELRVSRGVVTEAYQRLTEDGQVAGRGRAGTVVVAAPVTAAGPTAVATPVTARAPPRYRTGPQACCRAEPGVEIFDELRAAPARIDLSPGVPDLAAFPRAAWLRAERAVLDEPRRADFGYGDPRGSSGAAAGRGATGWPATAGSGRTRAR